MSTVENLNIEIDVDTSAAHTSIDSLIQKIDQLETKINRVDGETIYIDTELDGVEEELAAAEAKAKSIDSEFDIMGGDSPAVSRQMAKDIFGNVPEDRSHIDAQLDPHQRVVRNNVEVEEDDTGRTALKLAEMLGGTISDSLDSITGEDGNLFGFELRMEHIMTLMANLMPLMAVFAGALPAAIAGVTALGAAALAAAGFMAAFAGLGLLGLAAQKGGGGMNFGKGFEQMMKDLKQTFWEAFSPIARRMIPLVKTGLRELESLFGAVADILFLNTNMVKEMLSGVGQYLRNLIPKLIVDLLILVREFRDEFAAVFDSLSGVNITEALIKYARQVIPILKKMGSQFMALFPKLMQASIGFLRVASYLVTFLTVLSRGLAIIPLSAEQLGFLAAAILTTVSAIAFLNFVLTGSIARFLVLIPLIAGAVGMLAGSDSIVYKLTGAVIALGSALAMAAGYMGMLTGGLSILAGLSMMGALQSPGMMGVGAKLGGDAVGAAGSSIGGMSGGGGGGSTTQKTQNVTYNIQTDSVQEAKRAARNYTYKAHRGFGGFLNE